MIRLLAALVLFACSYSLWAQACPVDDPNGPSKPSEVRTLHGSLIYHDSIRQWFELRLDAPVCGQPSIQLVRLRKGWRAIEELRGCLVESKGRLDIAGTGYYSANQYQDVTSIKSLGLCERQRPFPDYSKLRPAKRIRNYQAVMLIHYGGPEDSPVRFQVTNGDKELQPWQVYASYDLTGGYVLYGHCGKGFVVGDVFGTKQANPGHFDEPGDPGDMAAFDPESAAADGVHDLRLGYTCVRKK